MIDRWLTDGCTVYSFKRKENPRINKRIEFLEKWSLNRKTAKSFPFHHGLNSLMIKNKNDESWFDYDQLVIPIIKHLNEIGIETLSSCQGYADWSPSILFTGSCEDALKVRNVFRNWYMGNMKNKNDKNVVINLNGHHEDDEFPRWEICMYDTLTLIEFSMQYLKISLEEQVMLPKEFNHIDEEEFNKQGLSLECPTLEEWQEVLELT